MKTEKSNNDFLDRFDALVAQMREKLIAKNHDYAGGGDPFSNFRQSEKIGIPAYMGILVRMLDKDCRIKNFEERGILKVEDEKIEDTFLDMANYAILSWMVYNEDKKK